MHSSFNHFALPGRPAFVSVADAAQYLGLVVNGPQNPTARVEYALRADDSLTEAQVRQIMEYYLAVRMRRFGRVFQSADAGPGNGHGRPDPATAPRPMGFRASPPSGMAPAVGVATRAPGTSTMTRTTGRDPNRY